MGKKEGALASDIQKRIEDFISTKEFRKICCEIMDCSRSEFFNEWYLKIFYSTLNINTNILKNKMHLLGASLRSFEDYIAEKTVDLIDILEEKNWLVDNIEELNEFNSLKSLLVKMSKDKTWPIKRESEVEIKIEYYSIFDFTETGYWWDR